MHFLEVACLSIKMCSTNNLVIKTVYLVNNFQYIKCETMQPKGL